jgi:sec-independent protein translocase protein TatB
MEILGIGWQELIFIVMIALIVLGPKDMQKAGRSLGRWLNQLVQSDGWKVFQRTSSELRNLPRNLMREANMEMKATEKEIRRAMDPRLNPPPLTETENSIQPSDPTDTPPAVHSQTNAGDSSDEHVASK